jgi:polysaccharide export outer membrane protein
MNRTRALVLALGFVMAAWGQDGPAEPGASADELVYRVGAGDTLKIEVYGEPSMSREVRVTPTCRVEVQLIGQVPVCGSGTTEIAERIRARLADGFLRQPTVFVDVSEYGSQRVEVKGAVKKPGVYVLEGITTLSELISTAGGPDSASVFRVTLTSRGSNQDLDLSEIDQRPERVFVQAGDVVNLHPALTVSVFGEVRLAGVVPYRQGLTATEALGLAGGARETAGLGRSYLLRAKDGTRERVNIRRIQRGRAPDVELRPDDQLVIRKSLL